MVDAAARAGRVLAHLGQSVARYTSRLWRAVVAIPPALRLFVIAGVGTLVGVQGAIALPGFVGSACVVVVVPLCSIVLGALGHRWYVGLGTRTPAPADATKPAPSELRRSLGYVDDKLAVVLSTFGTDHHQQAVIALFQAKTAVELTLGTEQQPTGTAHLSVASAEHSTRPRIRLGSASTSSVGETNSQAAS